LDHGVKPLCKTKDGCEIEESATSLTVKRLIDGFIAYKRLNNVKAPEFLQMECLKKYGIMDIGFKLIAELESVHSEFMQHVKEEADKKQKLKNETNSLKQRLKNSGMR